MVINKEKCATSRSFRKDHNVQAVTKSEELTRGTILSLPYGIVGMSDIKEVQVVYGQEELPFMRMQETKEDGLEFFVLEPNGVIPDYSLEIRDEDLELLGIESEKDVYLLNIVTVHKCNTNKVTVNLIAPLVFNKKTLEGRQVIIGNFQDYSDSYLLTEDGAEVQEPAYAQEA